MFRRKYFGANFISYKKNFFEKYELSGYVTFYRRGTHGISIIIVGRWFGYPKAKSWMRLFVFHIVLIPLGKIWIQSFNLLLWVNSRSDWLEGKFNSIVDRERKREREREREREIGSVWLFVPKTCFKSKGSMIKTANWISEWERVVCFGLMAYQILLVI